MTKKSYFIIIRGPLGSGKSTITQKIAKILRAEYIPIDRILDEDAGLLEYFGKEQYLQDIKKKSS